MKVRLAIDIGNTRTKFATFEGREMVHTFSLKNDALELNNEILNSYEISALIISSVNEQAEAELEIPALRVPKLLLSHATALPFKLEYQSPDTLGKDRIAAVAGAQGQFPNQNTLVIDAGTCVTYDFLTAEGDYLGGAISPGVQLRLQAMNDYTSKLPLLKWEGADNPQSIGDTTITSMLSGAVNGLISEMRGFIESYEKQYKSLKIVITGGDSNFFVKELKNGIFADPNLVLKGLNDILIYNGE
ncbi:type III pantothenate kinase [Vicingaceae bacterium]|nr:type III pantothenate kinase [Vicingaceae bacterium]MDB9964597.1 type III pantothenate kinase [Vicingaceae bacterium]MDC0004946.1 type III pantothenate kinase [bacterium]MDC1451508.1 type III pantothenate kinase [Vicingaceae bacterium]